MHQFAVPIIRRIISFFIDRLWRSAPEDSKVRLGADTKLMVHKWFRINRLVTKEPNAPSTSLVFQIDIGRQEVYEQQSSCTPSNSDPSIVLRSNSGGRL